MFILVCVEFWTEHMKPSKKHT